MIRRRRRGWWGMVVLIRGDRRQMEVSPCLNGLYGGIRYIYF